MRKNIRNLGIQCKLEGTRMVMEKMQFLVQGFIKTLHDITILEVFTLASSVRSQVQLTAPIDVLSLEGFRLQILLLEFITTFLIYQAKWGEKLRFLHPIQKAKKKTMGLCDIGAIGAPLIVSDKLRGTLDYCLPIKQPLITTTLFCSK